MKYRLGDTVRVHETATFKALNKEEMNQQLQETLIALHQGTIPEYASERYRDVVLTTQEMVDEYNERLNQ